MKLGNEVEKTISRPKDVCEEIKTILVHEIAMELISKKTIERYCKTEWKKQTKPKKQEFEKDKLSFSETSDNSRVIEIYNNGRVASISSDQEETLNNPQSSFVSNSDENSKPPELENRTSREIEQNTIPFELSLDYLKLQAYMADEFRIHPEVEKIWLHGVMDKLNYEIISFGTGRIGDTTKETWS